MLKRLQSLKFLSGLMLLLTVPAWGQTFWRMIHQDNPFQGGTIFSFNAQTNQCNFEYVFKSNPVSDAY